MIFAGTRIKVLGSPIASLNYTCASANLCSPTNSYTQSVFKKFQSLVNSARKLVGLSGDLKVDGYIGASTVAKFIKLVEKLPARLVSDPFFEPFIILEDINQSLPTAKVLISNIIPLSNLLSNFVESALPIAPSPGQVPIQAQVPNLPKVSMPYTPPSAPYTHTPEDVYRISQENADMLTKGRIKQYWTNAAVGAGMIGVVILVISLFKR